MFLFPPQTAGKETVLSAGALIVTATTGSITTASLGRLQATALTLTAHDGVTASTNVDSLAVNTSSGNGNVNITETNVLTALNINAGTGDVVMTVLAARSPTRTRLTTLRL